MPEFAHIPVKPLLTVPFITTLLIILRSSLLDYCFFLPFGRIKCFLCCFRLSDQKQSWWWIILGKVIKCVWVCVTSLSLSSFFVVGTWHGSVCCSGESLSEGNPVSSDEAKFFNGFRIAAMLSQVWVLNLHYADGNVGSCFIAVCRICLGCTFADASVCSQPSLRAVCVIAACVALCQYLPQRLLEINNSIKAANQWSSARAVSECAAP